MEDTEPMIRMFFAEEGIHVVSGGSTSRMVAEYLDAKVIPSMQKTDHDIPPISTIRGVDLTTEALSDRAKTAVKEAKEQIISGDVKVPDQP